MPGNRRCTSRPRRSRTGWPFTAIRVPALLAQSGKRSDRSQRRRDCSASPQCPSSPAKDGRSGRELDPAPRGPCSNCPAEWHVHLHPDPSRVNK